MKWENVVRIPTGTVVTACALATALLLAGCGGASGQGANVRGQDAKPGGELRLDPAAAQGSESGTGPGPAFGPDGGPDSGPASGSGSASAGPAVPSPVTRTPQSPAADPDGADCGAPDAALAPAPGTALTSASDT